MASAGEGTSIGTAVEAAVPCTLLGLLLQGKSAGASSDAVGDRSGICFMREYAARATNIVLWAVLIAVTVILLRRLGRVVRFWAKGSRIPGPPILSFYRHSKLIPEWGDLTGYLSKLHEIYGPIVRLWLSPTELVVSVTDLSLIKEVLIKEEDKSPLPGRLFRLAFGDSSLFAPSFDLVQQRRESLEIQLNGVLLGKSSSIPLKVLDCIVKKIDAFMAEGPVDCEEMSQCVAFSIIGSTLFGHSFLTWSNADTYRELLMRVAKDASFWASYNIPPIWKRGFWRYWRLCTRLKGLTRDILVQCGRSYTSFEKTGQTSWKETAEGINLHLILEDEPYGNIMGMMFHGYLKISGLINNILIKLVLNPEMQEKSFWITSFDVQKMQFLLATVFESARLLPSGPLLQRCSLKHDLNLRKSLTIPAGAIFVVPVHLVQTDSTIWGKDACQFNPLRFVSKTVMYFPSLADVNCGFLPFGSGKRACVGQKFAVLAISTLLASWIQEFQIQLHAAPEDSALLQHPPSPKIMFVRRS
ncbi:unnamed protein product [Spirodela intermedia]|uniref:Uncharacterized protein n=1 Tax=Spirodela intermedia TaxID=51605 RepID=A0A7I8I8J0_SPIIN|nr:unnamed protein product [Spirodela intermedia]CAA6653977.1 unnamed protein product [Spirodela intermedia]